MGNNGNSSGVTFAAGYSGNGAVFDGLNNDYGLINTTDELDSMQNMTISLWAYLGQNKSTTQPKAIHMNGAYTLSYSAVEWEPRIRIYNGSSTTAELNPGVAYTNSTVPGKWYHIVATYNGDTGNYSLYVNGTMIATGDSGVRGKIINSSNALYIGIDEDQANNEVNGTLDSIKIFAYAMTAEDVLEMYEEEAGIEPPADPDGYYFAQDGDDSADCSSSTPCRTIAKMNSMGCAEVIYLNRGDIWRVPNDTYIQPGTGCHYQPYGTGNKPAIYGSNLSASTDDWTDTGSNIWKYDYKVYDEVANIIFTDDWTTTTRNWSLSDMASQGEKAYFHSLTNHTVYMYATANPYTAYGSMELAMVGSADTLVYKYNADNIEIDGLAFLYGGVSAIQFQDVENINITNNTMAWFGGGYFSGSGDTTVRYGNTIQTWKNADNVYIAYNNISETLDAAITPQFTSSSATATINDWTAVYNIITNSAYCFEQFIYSVSGNSISNVHFDHNTCYNIGEGWYKGQRYQTVGTRGLRFGSDDATNTNKNLTFKDNIFSGLYEGDVGYGLYIGGSTTMYGMNSKGNYTIDYNLYHDKELNFGRWGSPLVLYSSISTWVAGTVHDDNSIYDNPLFKDAANGDFTPYEDSPACGAASDGGDIGALTCEPPSAPDTIAPYNGTFTNNGTNAEYGEDVTFSVIIYDDKNLSSYTWCVNESGGACANETTVYITGNYTYTTTITVTTNASAPSVICARIYANDTSSNDMEPVESCYQVISSAVDTSLGCTNPYFENFTSIAEGYAGPWSSATTTTEYCQYVYFNCSAGFDSITPYPCRLEQVNLIPGTTITTVRISGNGDSLSYSVVANRATIGDISLYDSIRYQICTSANGNSYSTFYKQLGPGEYWVNGTYAQFYTDNIWRPIDNINLSIYNSTGSINFTSDAYDSSSNPILNYTSYGLTNITTTNGKIIYPFCVNDTREINITISATNYQPSTVTSLNISTLSYLTPYHFFLLDANTLNISLYYENNLTLVNESVIINLYKDDYSANYTATNGTYYLKSLPEGTYIISAYNANYPLRSYYIDITNTTASSIDMYLLSGGTIWEINVKDQKLVNFPNMLVKLQRYFISENAYIQVDQCMTNDFGNCNFYITPNTQYYKLLFEYGGTNFYTTLPTRITDTTNVQYYVIDISGESVYSSFWDMDNVYTELTFPILNNDSVKAHFTFTDTSGLVASGCVFVYKHTIKGGDTLICENCVETASGTAICEWNRSIYYDYIVKGRIHTTTAHSNYTEIVASIYKEITDLNIAGQELAFYSLLIFVVLAIIGAAFGGPSGSLLGVSVALIITSALGWVPIAASFVIGIPLVVIIFILLRKGG
jgi:hypothetical protein